MLDNDKLESFIAEWALTGGSELANTHLFVVGLCSIIGVAAPSGAQPDNLQNDYVFERTVFQDNGDGTNSFGRLDAYKRNCFVLEAKQGTDADKAAASRGEADFFGKPISEKLKQGTARRGTPGWAAAMIKAKGQAERYAKALPVDHGWPPFLLITDVDHCIDVYADFSGTGKQYTQFPDAARFRIKLGDLRDAEVRERLTAIWTEPLSLDPSKEAAKVTREIAGYLADLSKRLEARENNPTRVADFLMRCLFTMFAEDVNLIPQDSFTGFLKRMQTRPENFAPQISALWQAMDKGGLAGGLGEAGETVLQFNGYLFKDTTAIALDEKEIGLLIEAASKKWNHVEPAIFGTLLERALDGKERAKLGAHYTPRAYVERLVMPTVMEPLRADWAAVQAAAASLIEADKADEARAVVETFHGQLAQTKVLDPACGTGNFLYVALARMKELEGEVVSFLTELGDMDYVLGLSGHTITPENFLGIEINPRAAAIAQLVLWIGYLQWHFRVNGEGKVPPEPVLRDVKTIENRDALITWDKKVLERDEYGKPLTIWDGTTMKRHPVTDELVPDETGQMELYRYVNPKQSKWPKASFIIGNPPFIGNKRMRLRLGDGYTEAVRKAYSKTGDSVDFVMYWWDVAGKAAVSATRRFGFITTNSITQPFNRAVIEDSKSRLLYAIADHPWVDGVDGAAVRIALTCAGAEKAPGKLAIVVNETELPDGYGEKAVQLRFETVTEINSDLAEGADTSLAVRLKSNANLSHQGMTLVGKGFRLTPDEARGFSQSIVENDPIIRPYIIGRDITGRREERYVIDAFGKSELELRDQYPTLYQVLLNNVKPERDQNHRASYRQKWWIYAEPRQDLRRSAVGLTRFIATCRTAKHRIFSFEPILTLPDAKVIFVGLEDGIHLGILTSKIHQCWAFRTGGWLGVGNDSNYNHSDCFGKFPFPADVSEPLKARIRAEAEALDALRKQVLAAHDDLTLTGLYNVLEALKAGRALTDKERDIHDRGLVTLVRQHHDAIDTAVAEAYGWPADLSDEDILTRLVALNKTRAAEEAKGMIRWLRPDFQSPGATAPQVNATLDLGDAPVATPAAIIPWPKTLAEQVSAVATILAAAPIPQHPRDIARAIQGTNAKGVTPVLDALTAIGQARKLADGRYAA
ncbi:DNA methyltransferase [Sphingorhabdus sp.]|uniref:class I SAM-dependent DNA methyltransferase n=1 Tax=Sphingorhabdus sp. TaxID=1902408 RepID=UPI00333E25AB